MASEHSFDIVSEIDLQELANALDQTRKEIEVRYDFRGVPTEIKQEKESLIITTADEHKLRALRDILETKLLRRSLEIKVLGTPKNEPASGGQIRSTVPLQAGIDSDNAKKINKAIRDVYPKIKTQIQGDTIRVVGKSIDELQAVMDLLKSSSPVELPLQFINYR